MNSRAMLLIIPALAVPLAAQNAEPPANLSAREIFYSPGPARAGAKPARKKPAAIAERKPAETERQPSAPANASLPPSAPSSSPANPVPASVRAPVLNATEHTRKALGLRYTLMKMSGQSWEPVGIRSIFHSGERIRINVEVNDAAYLYVISRGASGTWAPLFPSKDVADGSNRVEPGHVYQIPPGKVFTFSEPSGSERLFIVVSRQPETSLERLIYSVGGAHQPAPGTDVRPANPPKSDEKGSGEKPKLLMASAEIGDDAVGNLRAYSRDLIVEDASQDPSTPSPGGSGAQDESVYTVNPSGSPDSRVVADITLNHQ